ncbi:hypothetical protein [Nocardioides lijunqiniae]|uniref:hypothetical protein n=1 Tax=Nocardioides lijunqiniae TaxID=2760832 RepID=UPI001878A67F|nr:hypothetical protein [Nocardioides lijunqiniae]
MTNDNEIPLGRSFFIEVIFAGLVVFSIAVTIGLVTGAETGSVADWVAAIGTLAAFIAAIIAARYAANVVQIERRRDRLRDEALESAQAEMVAVWGEIQQDFAESERHWLAGVSSARMVIWNTSQLPIYNVDISSTVRLKVKGQPERSESMHATPRVIAPGDNFHLKIVDPFVPMSRVGFKLEPHTPYTVEFEITALFDDNAARRWRRKAEEPLERYTPPS